jgi:hypothetical protein
MKLAVILLFVSFMVRNGCEARGEKPSTIQIPMQKRITKQIDTQKMEPIRDRNLLAEI